MYIIVTDSCNVVEVHPAKDQDEAKLVFTRECENWGVADTYPMAIDGKIQDFSIQAVNTGTTHRLADRAEQIDAGLDAS